MLYRALPRKKKRRAGCWLVNNNEAIWKQTQQQIYTQCVCAHVYIYITLCVCGREQQRPVACGDGELFSTIFISWKVNAPQLLTFFFSQRNISNFFILCNPIILSECSARSIDLRAISQDVTRPIAMRRLFQIFSSSFLVQLNSFVYSSSLPTEAVDIYCRGR